MQVVKIDVLIAGGGIGGLAAALALARQGVDVTLLERAEAFQEFGAGIQIGPNVTRTLFSWGLDDALRSLASFPDSLQVRQAKSGQTLGSLPFGSRTTLRYGAPYASIARADLHQLLLQSVIDTGRVELHLNQNLIRLMSSQDGVEVHTQSGQAFLAQAMVGADGLWSVARQYLLGDIAPRKSGLLAYRTMIAQKNLPVHLRSQDVTVWLGSRMHAVQYPVRRGELLNLVVIVPGLAPAQAPQWDHGAHAADLRSAMGAVLHPALEAVLDAAPSWRLWPLCDRPPLAGAHEMAQGPVALLGDAAHPMRPFLAQGAGMAVEDADQLAQCWARSDLKVPERWALYAKNRWERNARVQQRSIRNGQIFHASGLIGWGRDLAIRLMGERLMDVPWLYGGP